MKKIHHRNRNRSTIADYGVANKLLQYFKGKEQENVEALSEN